MTPNPGTLSRRGLQQQTRDALIGAARAVFSEVGYHAAGVDRIAREAGFSKGAVYSNFEDKAALFLAVMDQNLELAEFDLAGPFEHVAGPASTGQATACRGGDPAGAEAGA